MKYELFIEWIAFSIICAAFLDLQLDHMDLIKALIVFGADVEIHNDLGETPGLIAARTSKGEAVMGWVGSAGDQGLMGRSQGGGLC